MDDFSIVTMKTKTEKKLYLKSGKGNAVEWTFDKQDAIWFQTEEEAEKFCKNYFKNFKNYEIETIKEYV